MKRIFYFITFSSLILALNSCSKGDNNEAWREANINAYKEIALNKEYKALVTESGPTGVYYKVIKSGDGTEHPIQTGKVKVLFKISYFDGSLFSVGTSDNNIPVELGVYEELYSGVYTPRGFSFALQNMVVGDKWEIWVPYYLAFGAYGIQDFNYYYYQSVSIVKGYTTLVYEVELLGITQYP